MRKVEQYANYVITIMFSHFFKIGSDLTLPLKQMLVFKQPFQINEIDQVNKIE